MSRYFLVVDAGTGSGRAVIFNTAGRQISIAQEEWKHISEHGVPNSMGFDTVRNWELICRCIRRALQEGNIRPMDIAAVSATSMREGIVMYDKGQRELFAVANVDARADNEVTYLKNEYPLFEGECYAQSGQTFALGAIPRIMWLRTHHPRVYEQVDKISMISDWVLTKLSGVIASEPSNAGTSGIFDLSTRQWVPSMAAKVGIKDTIFPPVYESGTQIGTITHKASLECGLNPGTPVITGGGDVQLGSAGLGVVGAGDCAILGGTFWQQLVNLDSPLVHPEMDLRINPHVIPGITQAEGITFFSGLVMRWFRDALCQEEVHKAHERGIDPYAYLESMASKVPVGSNGIMAIFSDMMHYGKWYHAAPSFLNLSIDPAVASKGAMFRSLQENAAIVSMMNLESIFSWTQRESDSITFAGGASKGELWCQILSDATGKTVRVPYVTEATALGGAFACGVGIGEYGSIAEVARSHVEWKREYTPDATHRALYQEMAEKWKEAYKVQLSLVDRGITTSMWRAPGV
ncbi:MAG: autoinducer-2 kinase [Sulfuricurvum sp.]|nr:autoinducer-2 kinase [Sulfuricurvum sp.]